LASQQPSGQEVGEQPQVVPAQARPLLQPASAQQGSLSPPQATQAPVSQASKVVQGTHWAPDAPQAPEAVPTSQPWRSQQPGEQLEAVQIQVPPAQLSPALQLTPPQQASSMPPQQAPFRQVAVPQLTQAEPGAPQALAPVPSSQPFASQQPVLHEAAVQAQLPAVQARLDPQSEPVVQQGCPTPPQDTQASATQTWVAVQVAQPPPEVPPVLPPELVPLPLVPELPDVPVLPLALDPLPVVDRPVVPPVEVPPEVEPPPEAELAALPEVVLEPEFPETLPEELDAAPPSGSWHLPAMQLKSFGHPTLPSQVLPTNETVGVNGKQPQNSVAARAKLQRSLTALPPLPAEASLPSRG
jgi:nicotinate-nucleotide--dimethylbenzimidazole phosphoribosyltransferase